MSDSSKDKVTMASELTVAWLSNPNVRATGADATEFLSSIHATLAGLSGGQAGDGTAPATDQTHTPAVSARKSLASRDKIISMIDGKPYTTLKRHLSAHGLTPAQYRERFGLKPDYPMTAPAYAEKRRDLAKKIGLGAKGRGARKSSAATAAAAGKKSSAAKAAPRKRGRPKATPKTPS